ncbi:MAG: hypothetical protein V4537_17980 [Pseudomonadota bacterium]
MKFTSASIVVAATILSAAVPERVPAQVAPISPVEIAVNGVFFLCPALVRKREVPSDTDLAKFGFVASTGGNPGELSFKGKSENGVLVASLNPNKKRCTVGYAGGGYEQISGVVRDTVIKNNLKRIAGGDQDGAKADVFEGYTHNSSAIVRIIIVENDTNKSSSIAYSER